VDVRLGLILLLLGTIDSNDMGVFGMFEGTTDVTGSEVGAAVGAQFAPPIQP